MIKIDSVFNFLTIFAKLELSENSCAFCLTNTINKRFDLPAIANDTSAWLPNILSETHHLFNRRKRAYE